MSTFPPLTELTAVINIPKVEAKLISDTMNK
jgi:hypothetical protein